MGVLTLIGLNTVGSRSKVFFFFSMSPIKEVGGEE